MRFCFVPAGLQLFAIVSLCAVALCAGSNVLQGAWGKNHDIKNGGNTAEGLCVRGLCVGSGLSRAVVLGLPGFILKLIKKCPPTVSAEGGRRAFHSILLGLLAGMSYPGNNNLLVLYQIGDTVTM